MQWQAFQSRYRDSSHSVWRVDLRCSSSWPHYQSQRWPHLFSGNFNLYSPFLLPLNNIWPESNVDKKEEQKVGEKHIRPMNCWYDHIAWKYGSESTNLLLFWWALVLGQCESVAGVEKKLEEMKIKYVKGRVEEGGIVVDQLFFHDPDGSMIEICNCDNLPVVPITSNSPAITKPCSTLNCNIQQHHHNSQGTIVS